MKLHMVRMRLRGVAIPKKRLLDRFNSGEWGELSMMETNDQGQHRMMRLARFVYGPESQYHFTLLEPRLSWIEGERFVLTGLEQVNSAEGVVVYAQAWMCIKDGVPPVPEGR